MTALIKSTAVGFVVAVAVGMLWGYFPDWQFYLALLLGFGVAEGMAWAANYKRGNDLQIAAVSCVVLGLIISRVVIAMTNPFGLGIDNLLNDALNPRVADVFQIRLIPDIAIAALAAAIPFVRFR